MRSILTEHNLYTPLFETVFDKLAKIFDVDTNKQRQDSTHIFFNMRYLGRIGLFSKTIKKFLVNLKRQHKDLFAALDKELADRCLSKREESAASKTRKVSVKTNKEVPSDSLHNPSDPDAGYDGHKVPGAGAGGENLQQRRREQDPFPHYPYGGGTQAEKQTICGISDYIFAFKKQFRLTWESFKKLFCHLHTDSYLESKFAA
jgi:hypothetical protein